VGFVAGGPNVSQKRVIRVAAAVIPDGDRYLLTQRANGSHMAGYWEFPGGKIEPGETPGEALARELREELGIRVRAGIALEVLSHDYGDRHVELHFLTAEILEGEPRALEVGDFGWFSPGEMPGLPVLEADAPLIERLRRLHAESKGNQT
jgi:8-oxo-dGTP diphosphatase